MPIVIYIFTLSRFSLGLAEFVPTGLTDVMARSLNINIVLAGTAITPDALGSTFAAPVWPPFTL